MPSAQIAHPNRFLQTSHFIVVYQRRDTLCRSISKICFHTPDGAGNNPEQSVHPFSAQQDLCPSALHWQSVVYHSRNGYIRGFPRRPRTLRSEHIRFIFHSALLHIEDIELFEAARFHSFLSVQNIVPDLVEHNDAFHHRMQIVFYEDKSVAHQNLIGSTLPFEIHGDDFDAKLTGDPVRISRGERIDQPICRLYDLQSLNIQERTPPSACFGNSILT